MPRIEVSEEKMVEMMKQAAYDGVVEAVCTECGDDQVRVEPDAITAYCECCEKVTELICPASVWGF